MKVSLLILMTLLPIGLVSLVAQAQDQQPFASPSGTGDALISAENSSLRPELDSSAPPEASPQSAAEQQRSNRSATVSTQETIPESMVGYVDDAIVASQIRVRFDAGFHDTVPDRAGFFYPQCACTNVPGAPGPNFPGASDNINFQEIYLDWEYAPVKRFSFFTELPFRSIEPQANSFIPGSYQAGQEFPSAAAQVGVSDVRVGIKVGLAVSASHALTIQLRAYLPSGNASKGLGTGHSSIEPSLLYYQRLSQRWAIESQIGDWHPIGSSPGILFNETETANFAGDVLLYGVGPSYRLITGERFGLTPVVELFGWHVFGGLENLPASFLDTQTANYICSVNASSPTLGCSFSAAGTNIVNLKAGVRMSFGSRNSVYLGFGQALTRDVWYKNIVRLEYRYSF